MFQLNIKAWSMFAMLNMFVLYIIVIDRLNKIWIPYQISFHLANDFSVNTISEQKKKNF